MKRRTAVIIISLLSAAVLALGTFALTLRDRGAEIERTAQISYQRAYVDFLQFRRN